MLIAAINYNIIVLLVMVHVAVHCLHYLLTRNQSLISLLPLLTLVSTIPVARQRHS